MMDKPDIARRFVAFVLLGMVVAIALQIRKMDEPRKRYLGSVLRQVRYLPGRYMV